MAAVNTRQWQEYFDRFPAAHLLQSGEWGELKSKFGWKPVRVIHEDCGVQILFRRLPLGLTIGYIPKGPLGHNWAEIWPETLKACKSANAIVLRVEPDAVEEDTLEVEKQLPGFVKGSRSIQPRRTIIIDLTGSESDWLVRMKQKTRYNIHLAERKGVRIEESNDLVKFEKMMQITGVRDGFGVHSLDYYKTAYDLFSKRGRCALLEAKFEDTTLAMMMVFASGIHGYYLYGASGESERNRMPTYLLQWEAMKWCAAKGCQDYDLYGIPDADEETLEREFENRSDGLWGVYRFKRGFGGKIIRSAAPREKVFMPFFYRLLRLVERND